VEEFAGVAVEEAAMGGFWAFALELLMDSVGRERREAEACAIAVAGERRERVAAESRGRATAGEGLRY
jgi:hypothetical protein